MDFTRKLLFSIAALFLCLSLTRAPAAKEGNAIPFHLDQKQGGKRLSSSDLATQAAGLLFQATNQERQGKKLNALAQDEVLAKAARDHSQDMLKRNYLSHFSPEGKSVVDRVQKYQVKIQRSLGENVHMITSSEGLFDPKAVANQMMDDWMHSPSHRKNILSKDYGFLGVACASDGQRIFCTQVFGGPNLK